MARLTVGLSIPDRGIVMYECDQHRRHTMKALVKAAYALGGMKRVREFIAETAAMESTSR